MAHKEESDSDKMEIEEAKHAAQIGNEDVPGPATPDRGSDDETASEDEVSDSGRGDGSSETLKSTSTVAQPASGPATSSGGLPPPRALPFGRASTRNKGPGGKPLPPPPVDDDDDETDDEEL